MTPFSLPFISLFITFSILIGYIVISHNLIRAAIVFLGLLISIAFVYFIADNQFVGMAQIMVYAGGILVVIIFGIMLTQDTSNTKWLKKNEVLKSFLVLILLGSIFVYTSLEHFETADKSIFKRFSTVDIGTYFIQKEYYNFELITILLLIALIGSAFISKQES